MNLLATMAIVALSTILIMSMVMNATRNTLARVLWALMGFIFVIWFAVNIRGCSVEDLINPLEHNPLNHQDPQPKQDVGENGYPR